MGTENLQRYYPRLDRLVRPAAAAFCGVLLVACGSDNEKTIKKVDSADTPVEEVVSADIEYFDNGTRLTIYNKGMTYQTRIVTFCDGPDLMDQNVYGGAPERSQDHPACDDGKVTAQDFRMGQ